MTPDVVHRILATPIPLPQTLTGPITLTRSTGEVVMLDGNVEVGDEIVAAISTDRRILTGGHEHCDVSGATWRAARALVMLASQRSTWDEAAERYNESYEYRVHCPELIVGAEAEQPAFTRESFVGLEMQAPFAAYEAFGERHLLENWIPITVFGREGAIYKSKTHNNRDCLSVLYRGGALAGDEHAALVWLVRYLVGASENTSVSESFDNEQSATMSRVRPHGSATRQSLPPLLYNRIPGFTDQRLQVLFDPLLIRVKGLTETPRVRWRLFGILLAYLDAADTHYAITRGRCAIIALDALISLVTPQQKLITDSDVWRILKTELEAVVARLAPEPVAEALKNSLNVNTESLNKRRRRFFEHLGIEYTPALQRLIRDLRNPAVHERIFGADDITLEGHLGNVWIAEKGIDLFNRAMLSYLGYDGGYRVHEHLDDQMPPREGPVRDRLPDVELDRLTSRAAGQTQFMRPEITMERA
jgi:hypothetical protein